MNKQLLLLGAVALGGLLLLKGNSSAQSAPAEYSASPEYSTVPGTSPYSSMPNLFSIDLSPPAQDNGWFAQYQAQQEAEKQSIADYYKNQLADYYAGGGQKDDYSLAPAYDAPHEQKAFSMLGKSQKEFETQAFAEYVKSPASKKSDGGITKGFAKFKTEKLANELKAQQKAKNVAGAKIFSNKNNLSTLKKLGILK